LKVTEPLALYRIWKDSNRALKNVSVLRLEGKSPVEKNLRFPKLSFQKTSEGFVWIKFRWRLKNSSNAYGKDEIFCYLILFKPLE
jgi:hypothetical protein